MANVNYEFVLEAEGIRYERSNRRMFAIIIILILSLIGTNAGWLYYESQFEESTVTEIKAKQEAEGNGQNYVIGGDYADKTESDDN